MNYRAVLFDFNGLIVDDEALHCELFQKILSEEDITMTDEDYWKSYVGYDDRGLIQILFEKAGRRITPKKLKFLITTKNRLYLPAIKKKLKFFPGVIEFVREIKSQFLLAVVSGGLRGEIDYALKKGGIQDAFQLIISAEDVKHGKPDPEGFVVALAKLKRMDPEVRPGNCLVLEDSHAGIEAAKRAGMRVVALTHTYSRDHLKDADCVVDTFEEISRLLI